MSGTDSGGSSDGGDTGSPDTGTHPEVDATVRLLHRRRGWGWTGGGSLLALVVFSILSTHLWANAGGALGAITGLVALMLLALAVVVWSVWWWTPSGCTAATARSGTRPGREPPTIR